MVHAGVLEPAGGCLLRGGGTKGAPRDAAPRPSSSLPPTPGGSPRDPMSEERLSGRHWGTAHRPPACAPCLPRRVRPLPRFPVCARSRDADAPRVPRACFSCAVRRCGVSSLPPPPWQRCHGWGADGDASLRGTGSAGAVLLGRPLGVEFFFFLFGRTTVVRFPKRVTTSDVSEPVARSRVSGGAVVRWRRCRLILRCRGLSWVFPCGRRSRACARCRRRGGTALARSVGAAWFPSFYVACPSVCRSSGVSRVPGRGAFPGGPFPSPPLAFAGPRACRVSFPVGRHVRGEWLRRRRAFFRGCATGKEKAFIWAPSGPCL